MPYKNREDRIENLRRYYHEHKDAFKAYREKHKEKRKVYNKEYQKERNKDEEYMKQQNERILAWYHANFEKNKENGWIRNC